MAVRARVKYKGKERYLGRFATSEEAHQAQTEFWTKRGINDPRSDGSRRGWETRRMIGVGRG